MFVGYAVTVTFFRNNQKHCYVTSMSNMRMSVTGAQILAKKHPGCITLNLAVCKV